MSRCQHRCVKVYERAASDAVFAFANGKLDGDWREEGAILGYTVECQECGFYRGYRSHTTMPNWVKQLYDQILEDSGK